MKKILLLMMCCPMILSAQNGVTVSNLAVHAGTVTFNVSWNDNQPEDFLWSDSVWVFVDYNNAGKMERLLLSGATLSAPSWPAAPVIFGEDDNYQGAWIVGNARSAGSFSAKVHLLTATADLHGVCAYASNYPPVGEYTAEYEIKFTGTPMYNIVLKHESGATITRRADSPFSVPTNYMIHSFTDATGAPGTIKCDAPGVTGVTFADFNPCLGAPYGSTYTLTDSRDQKTYKIKYMPDGKYWMVQNLSFGNCTDNSLKVDNTVAKSAATPTVADGYVGHCRSGSLSNAGYYYTWPAAMNNVNNLTPIVAGASTCSGRTSVVSACRGVCPDNFHMPTTDEIEYVTSVSAEAMPSSPNIWSTNGMMESVRVGEYFDLNFRDAEKTFLTTSSYAGYNHYSWIADENTRAKAETNNGHNISVRCMRNY
jgi:uncharacterized protein (TIGR02145 family)